MEIPTTCPGVPSDLLNPRSTWKDTSEYDVAAKSLANEFVNNFKKYADQVTPEVLAVSPKI